MNSAISQGNFTEDKDGYSQQYENYIYNFRLDFHQYLLINLYRFDISEYELDGIVDMVMLMVEPFMTRLIGNKERESISESMQMRDVVQQERTGGWSNWFRKPQS
jgi:lipid II:glycine glycyltransferase (peptidoglycan interpeptide bridge formation enzyme)